eukprot:GILK01003029.1.p1 GENE.GILK01003029.1~~GILK01003029.1.p1  ORF type:complete len:733 (-),score=137.04 GILK01003029.1:128-2326(-)
MADKKGKFVIKPFRPNVPMDSTQAEKTWQALQEAIHEIHNHNASTLSFEELYRNAYNLVLHKHGELLYKGVNDTVKNHLKVVANAIAQATDDLLLQELSAHWQDHKITMIMIRDILMYLDRTFVVQTRKIPVYDLGLVLFRDEIARHAKIKDRLSQRLLQLILKERQNELIDRSLLKSTLSMLVDVGVHSRTVYEEDFEILFLDQTATFYRQESQQYISQNTTPDYLKKAEQRLKEEASRVQHYLDASTETKLKDIVEKELISNHAKTLVEMENSGCVAMFRDNKIEDLARMYNLFSRVPATLTEMRDALSAYVKEIGKALVTDQEKLKDPVIYVQGLLELKDKYDTIVSNSFKNDKQFQKTLKEAFEFFINLDTRTAQFLSLYLDDLLKKGLKGLSEEDQESKLDKMIMLFRFLQDKDIFENYYKQHLAKRLLSGKSTSDDAERTMIAKLKTECGYQFTSKLEGMFTDMKLSAETMTAFKNFSKGKLTGGVELSLNILTTGFWPTQSVPPCKLPAEVSNMCESFKNYYLGTHTGRRITWQTNMGTADIKCTFNTGRHELNVSTYQMCALMMFNTVDRITVRELVQTCQIPDADLKRHLMSLIVPKFRVLNKEPKGKDINDDDVLSVNLEFASKLFRVKIPLVHVKETAVESFDVPEPVEEDRRHLIEAAIVRIMKSRKTLEHNNLVAEVTKQLTARFAPNPAIIKKRIESLIEREYLERSKTDRRVYNYLA